MLQQLFFIVMKVTRLWKLATFFAYPVSTVEAIVLKFKGLIVVSKIMKMWLVFVFSGELFFLLGLVIFLAKAQRRKVV